MHISLIAAMAENNVIGLEGGMPWHLPEDLKFFKKTTLGKPVIMGRKTFTSIGRALPGRVNIIITRSIEYTAEGCHVAHTMQEAIELATNFGGADINEIMIIGGGQIYAEALQFANRIYMTEIHARIDGDTYFPKLPTGQWREISRLSAENLSPDLPKLSFVMYDRISE